MFSWFWFSQSGQLLVLSVCLDTIGAHRCVSAGCVVLSCLKKLYQVPAFPKTHYRAVAPAPNMIGIIFLPKTQLIFLMAKCFLIKKTKTGVQQVRVQRQGYLV